MAGKVLLLIFCVTSAVTSMKLTRVVILGRHHIRAPVSVHLAKYTTKPLPDCGVPVGYLCPKGYTQERLFGDYFSEWLHQEDFIHGCPKEDETFIHANSPQRTRESAITFSESVFKNCSLAVQYKDEELHDPVFYPVLRDSIEPFRKTAIEQMREKLLRVNVTNAYSKLNQLIDFKHSMFCKETGKCDLTRMKHEVFFEIGSEPSTKGPLNIGNAVVDAFLMAYYNGQDNKEIKEEDWEILTRISKEDQNVRFNTTTVAKHVSEGLLDEFSRIIFNDNIKFSLLVGHDSNINSFIATLGFKYFELKGQYEMTPVGGKVVFQKYYDDLSDQYFLKMNYLYQSTDQIRNGDLLSLESPPRSQILELNDCKIDDRGFCPWKDFLAVMEKFK